MQRKRDFPLTKKIDYLNTAGAGLIPGPVTRQLQKQVSRHLTTPPYEKSFSKDLTMVEETRKLFAGFIGCSADELTFQPNTSLGISLVSEIIPWKRGDQVLIDDLTHPSNVYPWMNLSKRGVKLKLIESHHGQVDVADYEKAFTKHTKLVSVNWVSYVNGLTHDPTALGELVHEHGAYLLIDAVQGAGYLDINVRKWRTDFLITTNYKWLLSPFGAAELYVNRDFLKEVQSPHVGWRSSRDYLDAAAHFDRYNEAENARKFEPGNLDYTSIFGLKRSLEYMSRIGFSNIRNETRKLHERLIDGLTAFGCELLTPINNRNWSAIVFCKMPKVSGSRLSILLQRRKIHVTARSFKGFDGVRISPYFYNTNEDIERLLTEMKPRKADSKSRLS